MQMQLACHGPLFYPPTFKVPPQFLKALVTSRKNDRWKLEAIQQVAFDISRIFYVLQDNGFQVRLTEVQATSASCTLRLLSALSALSISSPLPCRYR